jgi:hypothetical protein
MAKPAPHPHLLRFAPLFARERERRLLLFFMLENLLKARAQSSFPTGIRGQDEDVNIYMAHLLTEHVIDPVPRGVFRGGEPLQGLNGEEGWDRWRRFEHYRRNGDHRLLALGLYGRGDLIRRRAVPLYLHGEQSWERDLEIGRSCYDCAVTIMRSKDSSLASLLPVLGKLADAFADYVNVLQTLARRRFGLGARLSDAELRDLASGPPPDSRCPPEMEASGMDTLLDLLSAYRRQPTRAGRQRLLATARKQGIDLSHLLDDADEVKS